MGWNKYAIEWHMCSERPHAKKQMRYIPLNVDIDVNDIDGELKCNHISNNIFERISYAKLKKYSIPLCRHEQ